MVGGNSYHFLFSLGPMAILHAMVILGAPGFTAPVNTFPLNYGNYP